MVKKLEKTRVEKQVDLAKAAALHVLVQTAAFLTISCKDIPGHALSSTALSEP